MIKINGFYLGKYKAGHGTGSLGFSAAMMRGGRTVAIYDDCAEGSSVTDLSASSGDLTALSETVQHISNAFPDARLRGGGNHDVEILCLLLDELRDILSCANKRTKFIVHLLMGNTWLLSPEADVSEPATLITHFLPDRVQDLASAKVEAGWLLEGTLSEGEFETCTGVWVVDMSKRPDFSLTLEDYLEIFKMADKATRKEA